ncbi:MAG: ABC transporter substrate-binding protein [Coriobacteriaceae bacterium]|nr:ABC transporter substrate-binding protein [Coriobacteriaceae bacterium]
MKRKIAATFCAAALTAAFGLAACSASPSESTDDGATEESSEQAAASYTINLGHLNSTAHVLAFVAEEEGFFDEEGVDATLTQFSSGSELVAGLESENLDVAYIGSVPTLVNQSSGHDISIFGGAMSNGHGVVIDSKYTEGLDDWDVTILKGKNVAVPRNTIQELELYEALSDAGLTYGEGEDYDVQLTLFESQKDAYNALSNESIDAVTTYSPYTSIAVASGYSVVYNCADIERFQNQPCCRQVALTSALEEEPEKFEAYERAIIKAYDFYKNNKDETIEDVQKYIDIPVDQIEYELYTEGYCDSNPDPDFDATESLKEDAVDFGYIEADFDLESKYNLDVYSNALESVIESDPDNDTYQDLKEHFEQYK